MEITYGTDIVFDRVLSPLDKFTLSFCKQLNALNIKYVLISGYVAIVFGRNRTSEDVDIIVEPLSKERFEALWSKLTKTFSCMQTTDAHTAYSEYLQDGIPLRFFIENPIPNMEVKFPTIQAERETLTHRKKLVLNSHTLYISSIEMQIAHKLLLGSEKDIEDAVYLKEFFSEHIDEKALLFWAKKLNVDKELELL